MSKNSGKKLGIFPENCRKIPDIPEFWGKIQEYSGIFPIFFPKFWDKFRNYLFRNCSEIFVFSKFRKNSGILPTPYLRINFFLLRKHTFWSESKFWFILISIIFTKQVWIMLSLVWIRPNPGHIQLWKNQCILIMS